MSGQPAAALLRSVPNTPPRKRKWKRLAPGIYEDEYSIRAIVDCAAGRKEKRYPKGTSLLEIRQWRNNTKTKLERIHPQRRAGAMGRGTFSAAAKRHLKTLIIASRASRKSELKAWEKEFGKVHRARVTQEHVKKAVKKWTDAGVAPKTILNRVRALTAMYHDLDGPDAWTPADNVKLPTIAKRRKPFVAPERIVEVEAELRRQAEAGELEDGWRWRARFMVLTSTGARPVFVKRAQAGDVDLERRVWASASAKGGEPVELFLNDEMLASWEAFIAADAWGEWDDTKYARIVRAAGWPEHVRPYAAKHTVGRELGERGVDMRVIADWFGHVDDKTTRDSYVPVLNSQIRKASELMNGRLPWKPASGRLLAVNLGAISDDERNAMILKLLEDIRAQLAAGS